MLWGPSQFIDLGPCRSVLSPIENKTEHSWDRVPGASFGVEMIQEVLTGPGKVSKWVLLI